MFTVDHRAPQVRIPQSLTYHLDIVESYGGLRMHVSWEKALGVSI